MWCFLTADVCADVAPTLPTFALSHTPSQRRRNMDENQIQPRIDGGHPIPLPVEPLLDMPVAALLVPMNYNAFKAFVSRHKHLFPARYRLVGRGHRRVRQISASEIRLAREMVIRPGR
jgi:hypothetical protein